MLVENNNEYLLNWTFGHNWIRGADTQNMDVKVVILFGKLIWLLTLIEARTATVGMHRYKNEAPLSYAPTARSEINSIMVCY